LEFGSQAATQAFGLKLLGTTAKATIPVLRYTAENAPQAMRSIPGLGGMVPEMNPGAVTERAIIANGGAPAELQGTAARVAELKAAIPAGSQGRITMSAAIVEDANGTRSVLIGTSEPGGYLRPGVTLNPGETMIPGPCHAEQDIINYATANNLKVIEIGATRPVCPTCAGAINPTGATITTPLKQP